MLTFDAALNTTLGTATTKQGWATALKNALGDTRRLRLIHDANASAADPGATGTEFFNVGMTGAMTISSGNITGFGIASNVTTRAAVDLMTGKSVLRIEGNGHWVQGTLGLSAAAQIAAGTASANVVAYDFTLSANLSATNGIGFSRSAEIKAPRLLSSGTGPEAGAIKPTTPTIIELVDWTDPANPVVVGAANFTTRTDNYVFEDAEMAAEIGDVAIYQLDNTIKWTSPAAPERFEFGGILMIASDYNSENGTIQLEQMLLGFKPLGRWATYPFQDTFIPADYSKSGSPDAQPCNNPDAADTTIPPPFKVNLKMADGTIVFTHEMPAHNGVPVLPINSPQLSQSMTATAPLRPFFNCGMLLPWQNTRTRASSKANKYFNGVSARAYGPKVARVGDACNPVIMQYWDLSQATTNSINHLYAMPSWPMRSDTKYGDVDVDVQTYDPASPGDPYLFNQSTYHTDSGKLSRITGWKYEPGSISGHDWRSANGGTRFDRSPSPSVLAIWASDQTWVRPKGAVPIRDMIEAWGMAYFNHSDHWLTNVQTFATIPKQGVIDGTNCYGSEYYDGYRQIMPPSQTIDLRGPRSDASVSLSNMDAQGRLYWSGWQYDNLHCYKHPAWWAVMLNSPMHAIAERFAFNTQWLCSLSEAPATTDPTNNGTGYDSIFMVRTQAWRWLSYTMAWKVAAQHDLAYSRAEVENRFQVELETMYTYVYKPAFIDNDPRAYFAGIRNLGQPVLGEGGTLMRCSAGGSLGLYIAHTLATMKQFGLWSVMKSKNDKCKAVLEMMIRNNDIYVIDYILDTDGRDSLYPMATAQIAGHAFTGADVPANWAAQKIMLDTYWPVVPPGGDRTGTTTCQWYKDIITDNNGNFTDEQNNSTHLMFQYISMRKTHFPEYPNSRIDDAIAKFQGFYDRVPQMCITQGTAASGTLYDFKWLLPSHGVLNAPVELGAN